MDASRQRAVPTRQEVRSAEREPVKRRIDDDVLAQSGSQITNACPVKKRRLDRDAIEAGCLDPDVQHEGTLANPGHGSTTLSGEPTPQYTTVFEQQHHSGENDQADGDDSHLHRTAAAAAPAATGQYTLPASPFAQNSHTLREVTRALAELHTDEQWIAALRNAEPLFKVPLRASLANLREQYDLAQDNEVRSGPRHSGSGGMIVSSQRMRKRKRTQKRKQQPSGVMVAEEMQQQKGDGGTKPIASKRRRLHHVSSSPVGAFPVSIPVSQGQALRKMASAEQSEPVGQYQQDSEAGADVVHEDPRVKVQPKVSLVSLWRPVDLLHGRAGCGRACCSCD